MRRADLATLAANLRFLPLALFGLVFAGAVLFQVDNVNGPWYWQWQWRGLKLSYFLCLGLPLPIFALALVEIDKPNTRPGLVLGLLVLFNFLLQILSVVPEPEGIARLADFVISPHATSYFTDALDIDKIGPWLAQFHTASLNLHSETHPPGPILYFYGWQQLLGPWAAAFAGGAFLGLLGSLGIVVLFYFAGLSTRDVQTRLRICSLYALMPGMVLFFPQFDQVYPLLSMALLLFWVRALRGGRYDCLYAGLILFVATFFAYNLLTLGTFMVCYAAYSQFVARCSWLRLLAQGFVVLGVCGLLHVALWALTGYHAILAFGHALENQAGLLQREAYPRPYALCLLFDLYDFFLGAGMLALPLLLLHVPRMAKEFSRDREEHWLSLCALVTILVLDLTGLLPGETARVWLFVQPLLMIPLGLEFAQMSNAARWSLLLVQWLILVSLKAKMIFIAAGAIAPLP